MGVSPSVYLSLSLSLSFSSRPLLPVCLSLSSVTFPPVMRRRAMLRWHRCARPRSQRQGPHTLSSVSSVSSLPPLRPFSSTFPCLVSVSLFLSLFLSLYSMHHRPRFLSFPANEQTDRAWAARIAFPSTPGRFHDPTYTFGCTCSRGILSRPVAQSQPTCCIAHFLPETYSYTPKAVSTTENCTFAYRVYRRRRAYRDRACDFYAQWE